MAITTNDTRLPNEDYMQRIISLPSTQCASCGHNVVHPDLQELRDAQSRILDLETQIKVLTLRATSAMEKATEYETSLRRMTSVRSSPPQIAVTRDTPTTANAPSDEAATQHAAPTPSSTVRSTTPERAPSRLARLLPSRSATSRSAPIPVSTPVTAPIRYSHTPTPSSHAIAMAPPTSHPITHQPPQPTEASLLEALSHEQSLRLAAESFVAKTQGEIEELTATLFEQANEMVAGERKARARLEERIEVLERRDGEKARRLGTLEERIKRVERVRGLLAGGGGSGEGVGEYEQGIKEGGVVNSLSHVGTVSA